MISIRTLTLTTCLLGGAVVVTAQTPTPAAAPPAPPAPPALAAPQAAPVPAAAPTPPPPGMHMLLDRSDNLDLNLDLHIDADAIAEQARAAVANLDMDAIQDQSERAREQAELAREKAQAMRDFDTEDLKQMAREQAEMAREQAQAWRDSFNGEELKEFAKQQAAMAKDMAGFAKGFAFAPQVQVAPMPPKAAVAPTYIYRGRMGSVDSLYERGQRALDNHRYDEALDAFSEVATRGGSHTEGALYWKAYTLNKLGRRDDATAALTELHNKFPNSHWLDDAKALEIEVKQSSGQKVSPDSESNDELKLLALEGLVQSDPDRAYSTLEGFLKKVQSPNLKKRAVYVLALSNSPKSQQLLEQIAKGGGNPDLQITAIQYLGSRGKDANKSQVLFEIYNSSSDTNVKRAVLNGLVASRDKDHLMQIAKSEKTPEMRIEAIRMVASLSSQPELWSLYQAEQDPDVKRVLLDYMSNSTDRLMEIVKTEKDAKLRRSAIQRLGSTRATAATDSLVQIYGSESDPQNKRAIIDALSGQRNAAALVAIGRKESDIDMKKTIVRRLIDMHSPEATQFLEEILK